MQTWTADSGYVTADSGVFTADGGTATPVSVFFSPAGSLLLPLIGLGMLAAWLSPWS